MMKRQLNCHLREPVVCLDSEDQKCNLAIPCALPWGMAWLGPVAQVLTGIPFSRHWCLAPISAPGTPGTV